MSAFVVWLGCVMCIVFAPTIIALIDPQVHYEVPLKDEDARFVRLKKAHYTDQDGWARTWEYAERINAGDTGIDGVGILGILHSKTKAFQPSIIIEEQFRVPVGKVVIELPAGLIDAGETAKAAAIRELREETGYEADDTDKIKVSPILVSNAGMTKSHGQLVTVNIFLEDELEIPTSHLDAGEHIAVRVIELDRLYLELNEYAKKGNVVDMGLYTFAAGYELANSLSNGAPPSLQYGIPWRSVVYLKQSFCRETCKESCNV